MRGKNILKTLVVTTVLALSMTTIHAADTNVSFDGDAEDFFWMVVRIYLIILKILCLVKFEHKILF